MRLATSLIISIAFHAVAFSYPVHFAEFRADPVFPVVLLDRPETDKSPDLGNERFGSGRGSGNKKAPATRVRHVSMMTPMPVKQPPLPVPEPSQVVLTSPDASIEVDAARKGDAAAPGVFAAHASAGIGGGYGSGYESRDGTGTGFGSEGGSGSEPFVQASYMYSPRPEYPPSARRDGREGRVLLRVLVDEQGKSKTIEVNQSSGSEALDRAAAEAVARWRFSPARRGNALVESWVKIPVDFQLQNTRH